MGHTCKHDFLEDSVTFPRSEEASLDSVSFSLVHISLLLIEIIHSLVCGCNCFLIVLKMVSLLILFYILVTCFRVKLLTFFNLQSRIKFFRNQVFVHDATLRFMDERYNFWRGTCNQTSEYIHRIYSNTRVHWN